MFSLLRAKKILMGKASASATETGSILDAEFTTPPILPSFPPETPIAALPPPPTDAELDAAWGEGASEAPRCDCLEHARCFLRPHMSHNASCRAGLHWHCRESPHEGLHNRENHASFFQKQGTDRLDENRGFRLGQHGCQRACCRRPLPPSPTCTATLRARNQERN
jgi:hypothetical protein